MTLKAKIAKLTVADATVSVPYAGKHFTVRELAAQGALFSADDYALIRRALGGGKAGRERARKLLPLQCPACDCRLTHFEPAGRRPYFAATAKTARHGRACALAQNESAAASAAELEPASELVTPPEPSDLQPRLLPSLNDENATADRLQNDDAFHEHTLYVIHDAAHELHCHPDATQQTNADVRSVPSVRSLLMEAFDGCVPLDSQVDFRGERYAIVSAAELHRYEDGDLVAVYGRICSASRSARSGRLTLTAAPHTVQVWATASVPRALLGARFGSKHPPVVQKPVPFIAFGRLKKLADVCGIPVIRQEYVELLRPLEVAARPRPSYGSARSQTDLTDELDALLGSPRALPRRFASAEC